MTPDDNSPTQPSPAPVKGPQPYDWFGNDAATPMPPPANLPPATNDGKPPIWNIPEPPATTSAGSGNLRGFGIGFAIALMVLGVMVLGLIIFLSASKGSPDLAQQLTPTPTSTPKTNPMTPVATTLPPLSPADASSVTTQFYVSYLGAGQFQNAYNLLSDDLKGKQSLQQFQQIWKDTIQVTINADSLQAAQANDGKSVNVALGYTQLIQKSGTSITTRTFTSTLVIAYDKTGQPRITNINAIENTPTVIVTPTATLPAPTATATTVPVTPSPTAKAP